MEDWKNNLAIIRNSLKEPQSEDISENIEVKPIHLQNNPLKVLTDRKGRNGKTATIIEGFELPKEEVAEIARSLKQKLGVGGSVRDTEILIQGDYKQQVAIFLEQRNFKVKKI